MPAAANASSARRREVAVDWIAATLRRYDSLLIRLIVTTTNDQYSPIVG
jgi:hypothetical protein